ncbi:coniferyl alcohol acyltransferase-like [Triticum aestivum]|uniref:coniferyl alcohol acyltransferase-like n=1 Tax=Triticum aestivum TaxID=4565 RepID=UPI001D0053B0|nr:coniferyl alcohol acyltransferase-like [Triticum aestivum]
MVSPNATGSGGGDLPIRVLRRGLVKASDPSFEPHVASFSNLDLYAGEGQASIVCLYPKLPNAGDFQAVVAAFESVLPSVLNVFYHYAGRIRSNPSSGLPELLCDNQGAELVVGEVQATMASLDYGLAEQSLKKMMLPYPEEVTLSVQLLSFSCGGFSVVWGNNDIVHDGHAITMFLRMWSQLARTGSFIDDGPPNHDRSVFRPRSPPSYRASISDKFAMYDHHQMVNGLTAHDSFVERLYYVEASDIASLREMASTKLQRSSRVQAVSAYLWKALAGVVAASRVHEERCCMGWMVDARRRVRAPELVPAMRNYFGNVAMYAIADATVEEIRNKELAEVAAMVREAITSIDYDEYIQELVDWVEEHKTERRIEKGILGLGTPTLNQTVFASFPLDTDFGFGDAVLAMPMWDFERLSSGYLSVGARPGGDGSWLVNAYIWPRLAAALESDQQHIFKPLTAEYLGLA